MPQFALLLRQGPQTVHTCKFFTGKLYSRITVIFHLAGNKTDQQMKDCASTVTDQCHSRKAFKDIKEKPRLRPLHSDSTSKPSRFLLSQQTLQGKCLLQLMLFSSIHNTEEVLAEPMSQNKYSNLYKLSCNSQPLHK